MSLFFNSDDFDSVPDSRAPKAPSSAPAPSGLPTEPPTPPRGGEGAQPGGVDVYRCPGCGERLGLGRCTFRRCATLVQFHRAGWHRIGTE